MQCFKHLQVQSLELTNEREKLSMLQVTENGIILLQRHLVVLQV